MNVLKPAKVVKGVVELTLHKMTKAEKKEIGPKRKECVHGRGGRCRPRPFFCNRREVSESGQTLQGCLGQHRENMFTSRI
jgi:hypothetical protein